jgi:DNA methylase
VRPLIHVAHCEDSFEFLRTAQDSRVDVTITDPPFPDTVQDNLCSGSLVGTKSVPKYQLKFPPLSLDQLRSGFADMLRITRRWVVSFCAVEDFGRLQDAFGKQYVRGSIWAKKNAMGQLTRDRPATAFEGIAWLHNLETKKRWNGKGSYGIWSANGTRGKTGRHPNEKPVLLAMKLVALASEPGETIFDPFCGSGAIGEAAVRLGRGYFGQDRDPEWVEKTRRRVERAATYSQISDETALRFCRMWGDDEGTDEEGEEAAE